MPPLAAMPTVTVPLTVAPGAGLVNDALSAPAFCTLTEMVVLPVAPFGSTDVIQVRSVKGTVAFNVWGPFDTFVLSHGSVTGPLDVSVPVARICPPMLSV